MPTPSASAIAGAAGTVCATCNTNNGTLAINARRILFTGGTVATEAATVTTSTQVALANDLTVMLPVGTVVLVASNGQSTTISTPTPIVIPAGTTFSISAGAGIILPLGADGASAAGSTVGLTPVRITLPAHGSYYFPSGGGGFSIGNKQVP